MRKERVIFTNYMNEQEEDNIIKEELEASGIKKRYFRYHR